MMQRTSTEGRRHECVLFTTLLVVTSTAYAAEPGLTILDEATGRSVPARVRIRDDSGKDWTPPDAQVVPIGNVDRWFVSDGHTPLDLPAGKYEIRIERGTEYRPVKRVFHIVDPATDKHVFKLTRWIDMRERGYVCGENHLHVPADELAPQLAAEGLDFGTSLQWWDRPRYEVPSGKGFVRDLTFAGVSTPTSIYDAEIERSWGAVYIVGIPEPWTYEGADGRPNLPLVKQAHDRGALVCYQGGWSREVLLDALLGCVDVVNVCNNNFHRHQYQPRSRYSNLLDVPGFPVYPGTAAGMMQMNTDTWYRLLNCGLRLAAGAGSATGPKKSPVGYNRAYVRAGKNPTLPEFLEAWRQGRNFVTCGPMIFLNVNGDKRPGDAIELGPGGGTVKVEVEAISDQPITALEIIVNGEVQIRALDLSAEPKDRTLKHTGSLRIEQGAWIAARCTDEDQLLTDEELAVHSYGGNRMPGRPTRLRFAHTSPIYVTVDGQSPRVQKSIEEARQMLDAFETFAMKTVSDTYRDGIITAITVAREKLTHLSRSQE